MKQPVLYSFLIPLTAEKVQNRHMLLSCLSGRHSAILALVDQETLQQTHVSSVAHAHLFAEHCIELIHSTQEYG